MNFRFLLLFVLHAGYAAAQQSASDPGGRHASSIALLGAFFLALLGAIFVAVIAFMLLPVFRKGRGIDQEALEQMHKPSAATERKLTASVAVAAGATVLILFGLIVISVATGKSISSPGSSAAPLVVEVIGNQWWWYVRYLNDDASQIVVTANELHIPVGRPVLIRGSSNDVIHSFWVPNLQGKRDVFPAHLTTEWIQADRPGRYRGQCAEFCGLQHAHMALWTVAETPAQFNAWMEHQRQPAAAPVGQVRQRGQQVFLNSACIYCHSIAGTTAFGQVGPDLTHMGSRLTLAAGTLPNNKGNLGGWISDPQNIKPGTHMATVPVKPEDMEPLLDYLESLQ
jgi:cytochrome c oxidase subunit II